MIKILSVGPGKENPFGGVGRAFQDQSKIMGTAENIDITNFNILDLKTSIKSLFVLNRQIRKAELIHIHCSFTKRSSSLQLLIPLYLAKQFGKKVIVTYHSGDPSDFVKNNRSFLKRIFQIPDKILVPSKAQKRLLIQGGVVREEKCEHLYNFVNQDYLDRSGTLLEKFEKENIVITVGAVNKVNLNRKGFGDFVDIAERYPNVKFLLIGKWVDDTATNLKKGAPSNLELTGYVDEEKLLEYYARAKVYLQLSARESFGIGVAEAMCFNCVPIVYGRGALPELVGTEGYSVKYGDRMEIVRKLDTIIKGESDFDPRTRILMNFTPDSYKEKYLRIVEDVMKRT